MGSQNMLSNVIGAPFPEYVLTQLSIRADHNSSLNRSTDEVLFIANKSAWVKLTSSVQINLNAGKTASSNDLTAFYQSLLDPSDPSSVTGYNTSDSLRQNWILEAGTSKGTSITNNNGESLGGGIDLRYGLGPDGAYGLGGVSQLGYRPMPGLTSVEIDTLGALGSLRQATIQFKVWNINQLNVIEALYFRLGYSMILEWGHTQYYKNTGPNGQGTFVSDKVYGLDLFNKRSPRKEEVQQLIARKSTQSSGNYQGMIGIVSNFNWSMNQEGGYDCSLKILGMGSIIDSMRVNLSYKMPDALSDVYEKYLAGIEREKQKKIAANKARNLAKATADATANFEKSRTDQGLSPREIPPVTDTKGIQAVYALDKNLPAGQQLTLTSIATYESDKNFTARSNYFYRANTGGAQKSQALIDELNRDRTGLFLVPNNSGRAFQVLPADHTAGAVLTMNAQAMAFYADTDMPADPNNRWLKGFRVIPQLYYDDLVIQNRTISLQQAEFTNYPGGFYGLIDHAIRLTNQSSIYNNLNIKSLGYDDIVKYSFQLPILYTDANKAVQFFYDIVYDSTQQFTFNEIRQAVANWIATDSKLTLQYLDKITPPVSPNTDTQTYYKWGDIIAYVGAFTGKADNGKAINFTFVSNDTGLIQKVDFTQPPSAVPTVAPGAEGTGLEGLTQSEINGIDSSQTDPGNMYQSSLHVMLTFIKSQLLYAAGSKNLGTVTEEDLTPATKLFYNDGIFKDMLVDPKNPYTAPAAPSISNNGAFTLNEYIIKGFNSNLLLGVPSTSNDDAGSPTQAAIQAFYSSVPSVDFKSLCKGYVINYVLKPSGNIPGEYPTYIKLGYLLAFLNNMCLIYDSTQDTDKHPYVYIDFNPETNFCLTNPSQLSVDPFTCLIPFKGGPVNYLKIFPEGLRDFIKSNFSNELLIGDISTDPLKTNVVNQDRLSDKIAGFKNPNEAYQGKTMEILLNINFLLDVLKQNITSDKEHAINLKGFLDAIVTGVNKSLGNINLFRVSYRDDSNTVIIKDDQFVPASVKGANGQAIQEGWALQSQNEGNVRYNSANQNSPSVPRYGMLPIFGTKSIVRELQFQTNMSTAISSQIAISAQAQTGSINSTDNSLFGYLNLDYRDVYKPRINNIEQASSVQLASAKLNKKAIDEKQNQLKNDVSQAEQFNTHIKSIYSLDNGLTLSNDKVSMAINYFIDGMSNIKAKDVKTSAAPFIPANLEITMDGIGGIVMGNAFTVPNNMLPYSLRDNSDSTKTKVGFIVVGLTHTIQNNQWLTRIKGQMIKLRDDISATGNTNYQVAAPRYPSPLSSGGTGNGQGVTKLLNLNINASPYPGAITPFTKDGVYYQYEPGSPQVLDPEAVTSANFATKYHPGFTFVKNKSNINLEKGGLKPLTEGEIQDDTYLNKFNWSQTIKTPTKFIIHHTGGSISNTAEDVYRVFYQRGYPAQYVIDGAGKIHRFMPDGAYSWHTGGQNTNAIGVEIIAADESQVNQAQKEAGARLAQFLGFRLGPINKAGEAGEISRHGLYPGRLVYDKKLKKEVYGPEGEVIFDYITKTLGQTN